MSHTQKRERADKRNFPSGNRLTDAVRKALSVSLHGALKNMGRSGTCLWKVLAGFAGWFREKTTHHIAWRLSDKSVARQRLREFLEREGVNSKEAFHQDTAPVVTIRQQADWWVVSPDAQTSPVMPATISGWRDALNALRIHDGGLYAATCTLMLVCWRHFQDSIAVRVFKLRPRHQCLASSRTVRHCPNVQYPVHGRAEHGAHSQGSQFTLPCSDLHECSHPAHCAHILPDAKFYRDSHWMGHHPRLCAFSQRN